MVARSRENEEDYFWETGKINVLSLSRRNYMRRLRKTANVRISTRFYVR